MTSISSSSVLVPMAQAHYKLNSSLTDAAAAAATSNSRPVDATIGNTQHNGSRTTGEVHQSEAPMPVAVATRVENVHVVLNPDIGTANRNSNIIPPHPVPTQQQQQHRIINEEIRTSNTGNGICFTPPPIVEHNLGTSKDDGVSDYSDASSLNDDEKHNLLAHDEHEHDFDYRDDENHNHQDNDDDDGEYDEDDEYGGDDVDDDDEQPIKLFIGQVPKHMEEPDLFAIFEKYGPMEDVAIIRDKHTGQHRGCAFVTFLQKESAEQCEKELHGTYAFEGGKRPVQIRPAGLKEENKIFVGMLPKDVTEEMVFKVFEPFGEITGVFVIKSTDGYRKGCAFVKFVNKTDAHRAIEELNNKVVFETSDRPLIVKVADSKKEKKKRMDPLAQHTTSDTHQGRLASKHSSSGHGSMTDLVYSDAGGASTSPLLTAMSPSVYYMPSPHGPIGIAPHGHPHSHGHLPPHVYATHLHGVSHGGHVPHSLEHATTHNHDSSLEFSPAVYPSHPAIPMAFVDHGYAQSHHHQQQQQQHISSTTLQVDHHQYLASQQQMSLQSNARPREGPAGANLFIYHLPHDLTDADLATAFNPFGNVISAKVFVDKFTGESKGFGFVSYDSVISAEQAIELMNGFQIGNKRLKVQHKRIHHYPKQTQVVVPMSGIGLGLGAGVGVGTVPAPVHHQHSPYVYPYHHPSAVDPQHYASLEHDVVKSSNTSHDQAREKSQSLDYLGDV